MSSQSWGYSELLLDMNKAKKVALAEYGHMMFLIDEEEPDLFDIETSDCSEELNTAIDAFISKILFTMEVEIYPRYISSEAEGTDLSGTIIWCVEPEYRPEIYEAMSEQVSWSEFG